MPQFHKVEQGDCLASIAKKYGFADWNVIWEHPKNSVLKSKRKNPFVLSPGDIVFIPDKEAKNSAKGTGRVHPFEINNSSIYLRLVLRDPQGQPYAQKRYELCLPERIYSGVTDDGGKIERKIEAETQSAELRVWIHGEEETFYHWNLQLGHLDPVEEVSGVQARLKNLGYFSGEANGTVEEDTTEAIKQFQRQMQMPDDGVISTVLRTKLQEQHGC